MAFAGWPMGGARMGAAAFWRAATRRPSRQASGRCAIRCGDTPRGAAADTRSANHDGKTQTPRRVAGNAVHEERRRQVQGAGHVPLFLRVVHGACAAGTARAMSWWRALTGRCKPKCSLPKVTPAMRQAIEIERSRFREEGLRSPYSSTLDYAEREARGCDCEERAPPDGECAQRSRSHPQASAKARRAQNEPVDYRLAV